MQSEWATCFTDHREARRKYDGDNVKMWNFVNTFALCRRIHNENFPFLCNSILNNKHKPIA